MRNIIILNGINLIAFILIVLLYFLFPAPLAILFGALWLIWVVWSNYKTLIKDTDLLSNFRKQVKESDRRHGTYFMSKYGLQLAENHQSIMAKDDFFRTQPETIYSAYELIQKKSAKYLWSMLAYLEQYDFVRKPAPTHLQTLCRNSNELVRKLHELSEDCFLIADKASDVDISVIDDLLAALDDMQDD